MSANDTQVGGTHYQAAYQHWDFMAEHFGSVYFKGVITKYLTRWRKKNGKEDLEKARHYLVKLIELVELDKVSQPLPWSNPRHYCAINGMPTADGVVFVLLCEATDAAELKLALVHLDLLLEETS